MTRGQIYRAALERTATSGVMYADGAGCVWCEEDDTNDCGDGCPRRIAREAIAAADALPDSAVISMSYSRHAKQCQSKFPYSALLSCCRGELDDLIGEARREERVSILQKAATLVTGIIEDAADRLLALAELAERGE